MFNGMGQHKKQGSKQNIKSERHTGSGGQREQARKFSAPVWLYPACFALLLAVVAFNCFYRLGQLPALDWDEARHGVSAYEMLKNGNFLVNTYAGQPDYWNLKPPLSFWCIALGYKLFGYNLFGMRFYSALAFSLTALAAGLFARRRYGKTASLAVLLLISCCAPFYRYHFARHGDADALFLLFAVLAVFSAALVRENIGYLYACGLLLSLSFLAKSWYALPVLGVIGLYFILSKRIRLPRAPQWALFALCALSPALLWAAARFGCDGMKFLGGMAGTDLVNRSAQALEGHAGGAFYYIQMLFSASPAAGAFALCIGLYFAFLKVTAVREGGLPLDGNLKEDFPLYLVWVFLPLFLFSLAQTKTTWYAVPLFFPIVLLGGLLFARAMQGGKKLTGTKVILCLLLAALAIPSYVGTWNVLQPSYQDDLQPFLAQQLASDGRLHGKNAYLVIENPLTPGQWDQSYLLLGELYLDFNCKPGGVKEFLSSPGSVLVISAKEYGQNGAALQGCTVVSRSSGFLCLTKN